MGSELSYTSWFVASCWLGQARASIGPIKSGIFSKILVDVKNVGERAPCSYLPLPSSYVFLTEHRPDETVCPHLGCSCDDLGSPPVLPMFKVSDEFLKYSKPLLRNRRKIVKSLVLFNIFRCF